MSGQPERDERILLPLSSDLAFELAEIVVQTGSPWKQVLFEVYGVGEYDVPELAAE